MSSGTEHLKRLRLDVPQVTLLAYELQKSGLPLPDGILTADELRDELKKLRKRLRLDVPQVTLLAYELQKSGLPLPDGILTADELRDELKKLRNGKKCEK